MDLEVKKAMMALLEEPFANPSSIHQWGQKARHYLESASRQVANFFGVEPQEIVFTSGATEALNLAISSIKPGSHVITSWLEHPAVLEPIRVMEKRGCSVTYLSPDREQGCICYERVRQAIRPNTSTIVLMAANNETGVMTDLEAIGKIASECDISLLVDGVAFLGKGIWQMPEAAKVICLSGHKIYGPTGVGCMIVKRPFVIEPTILGGAQQHGLRGGTENLLGIVGFAKAIELIAKSEGEQIAHIKRLRDLFEQRMMENIPDCLIHGKNANRVANVSCIAFLGIEAEVLLIHLDLAGVAASHGSACSTGLLEPSKVLINMGLSSDVVRSTLRFSLGKKTTEKQIEKAATIITKLVFELRSI